MKCSLHSLFGIHYVIHAFINAVDFRKTGTYWISENLIGMFSMDIKFILLKEFSKYCYSKELEKGHMV